MSVLQVLGRRASRERKSVTCRWARRRIPAIGASSAHRAKDRAHDTSRGLRPDESTSISRSEEPRCDYLQRISLSRGPSSHGRALQRAGHELGGKGRENLLRERGAVRALVGATRDGTLDPREGPRLHLARRIRATGHRLPRAAPRDARPLREIVRGAALRERPRPLAGRTAHKGPRWLRPGRDGSAQRGGGRGRMRWGGGSGWAAASPPPGSAARRPAQHRWRRARARRRGSCCMSVPAGRR